MIFAAPAIPWITAGVSALMPLLTEAMRDKPDPEAAKLLIESKRQEMVDKAIGAGLDRKKAEAQVDAEIQKGFAEAERQGQFNFPGGEMLGMAILGGAGGWAAGKAASAIGKMMGKGAGAKASAEAAASKVADVDDVAKATTKAAAPAEDVYSAGFRSPGVDAMRRGAGDRVTPVASPSAGGNIGYTPPTERGFTMRDPDMTPFPSKGRGEFNVEVIGSTGGARSAPVTVEGPFPGVARGGERIGMDRPSGMLGYDRPIVGEMSGTPSTPSFGPMMSEDDKAAQIAAMFASRRMVPGMDKRAVSGRTMGERLFIQ